jgi:tetratricopeptide (TPR) repeat protein
MFSQSAHLPHDAWTTRLRVVFALSRHRFDEAAEWLKAALLVDPYAPWLHARLAWTYHLAADPDRSMNHLEESLRLFPEHGSTQLYGSMLLACYGEGKRAEKMAEALEHRSPYFDIAAAVHAYTLAREKRESESREILERLQWLSRERFVMSSFTPAIYAALGDVDNAIAELRTADEARCPWFFQMLADPRLAALHGHPEFVRMKASLDEMEATASETSELLV